MLHSGVFLQNHESCCSTKLPWRATTRSKKCNKGLWVENGSYNPSVQKAFWEGRLGGHVEQPWRKTPEVKRSAHMFLYIILLYRMPVKELIAWATAIIGIDQTRNKFSDIHLLSSLQVMCGNRTSPSLTPGCWNFAISFVVSSLESRGP